MLGQIIMLVLLLAIAAVVLVGSIVYRIREVREEQAAWDAVIARVRGSGLVSPVANQVTQEEGAREI